ncbi:hypothetical protein AB3X55_11265 [Alphaproteobacteria bacterium LSUCC0719]
MMKNFLSAIAISVILLNPSVSWSNGVNGKGIVCKDEPYSVGFYFLESMGKPYVWSIYINRSNDRFGSSTFGHKYQTDAEYIYWGGNVYKLDRKTLRLTITDTSVGFWGKLLRKHRRHTDCELFTADETKQRMEDLLDEYKSQYEDSLSDNKL